MKGVINLADSKKRDSKVFFESCRQYRKTKMVTANKQEAKSCRFIKGSLDTSLTAMTKNCSLEELSQKMIDGDPEINMELFGKQIETTSRIYLTNNNDPAYGVRIKEYVYQADGSLKEERDMTISESNINTDKPLRWTGRLMPKKQFAKKFAFANVYQISHVDGLTFDFLYEMAKELEDSDSFLFLAAGEKANEPLIFSRNGTSYRGFLEGRTKDKEYMLLLHLTNLELKPIPKVETDENSEESE